jgi:hypothetical protein
VISSEIDLRICGFEMGEIDGAFEGAGNDEEDDLPALNETSTPVTQLGDPLAARRASHPLRRCPDVRELRPASRRRAGPDGFYGPAVEHSDRRPCLGPGVLAIADEVIE